MTERIAALILAAGKSSRMGQPKALLHFGGRPILEALVEVYRSAELHPIIVVASGATLAAARELRGPRVIGGDPAQPMIDSIARGVAVLPDDCPGVVIQPVDAPFTNREMLAALLSGAPGRNRVLCHGGRAGHPVLIAPTLFAAIEERPASGLREILATSEVELVEWPDKRVLADLDSPDDLAMWQPSGTGELH